MGQTYKGYLLGFDDLEEFEDYIAVLPYINDNTSYKYSHFRRES